MQEIAFTDLHFSRLLGMCMYRNHKYTLFPHL